MKCFWQYFILSDTHHTSIASKHAVIFWALEISTCMLSHVWLCNPRDCSHPGSSVHGIFQARILECLPCPPPGDRPNPGIDLSYQIFSYFLGCDGQLSVLTWLTTIPAILSKIRDRTCTSYISGIGRWIPLPLSHLRNAFNFKQVCTLTSFNCQKKKGKSLV